MDVHALLKKHGLHRRPDYAQMARWAAKQRRHFAGEAQLVEAVLAQFGASPERTGMRERPAPYRLWADPTMPPDGNAIEQLKTALALPVAVGGAGMPDLHKGYSLPIGGVVVLDQAISPAFVGYDISCMMMLTVLDTQGRFEPEDLEKETVRRQFLQWVLQSTSFGVGSVTRGEDHPVLEHPLWRESRFLRDLKDLAASQIGSSGAGNHFADIVLGRPVEGGAPFIGLLTHSGSRGVGNKVGHHFSALADQAAAEKYRFPQGYGWFDLNSELGQEYFQVMNLMGEYALANHQIIHRRFLQNAGMASQQVIWNKHNFAWVDEQGRVVHRKGATPAEAGREGIIPGTSGSESYLVRGKGNPDSWFSASHGAGRPHSRSEAKRRYDPHGFNAHMKKRGITHHGVAPDETIDAYKDINRVMAAQTDLVEIRAVMLPKVVVMGGGTRSDDGD